MAISLIYDPRGHTWDSWQALMVEAYASQPLQMNVSETNWREWGQHLLSVAYLNDNGIANPELFENWQEWAQHLVNIVNQNPYG